MDKKDTVSITDGYYTMVMEGVFEDGTRIEFVNNTQKAVTDRFDEENIEFLKSKMEKRLTDDFLKRNVKKMASLSDNEKEVVLINVYIQKIKEYTNKVADKFTIRFEKIFLLSKAIPKVAEGENKCTYYVYKHYYYDKDGNEVIFYVGKGTGNAKGSDARIYSHCRNKYWESIVKELEEKQIKYYFEPIVFFENEVDALNYEKKLQKKLWEKGQCLGCADLRRRYERN